MTQATLFEKLRALALLPKALISAARAQSIKQKSIEQTWRRVSRIGAASNSFSTNDIRRATLAACAIVSRLGGLGTCLVRSMTAASMLQGRDRVTIKVGFRPSEPKSADGHAWLLVGDTVLEFYPGEAEETKEFSVIHTIFASDPRDKVQDD